MTITKTPYEVSTCIESQADIIQLKQQRAPQAKLTCQRRRMF